MKVILKEDVDNLGTIGEIVDVKDGYGRNYLIPRGLALLATRGNMKAHREETRQQAYKLERLRDDAEALAERLAQLDIRIPARVGEENRIFGTVTTQQIADMLATYGLNIDRRRIELHEDIRSLGVYPATVKLHPDVAADIKVRVIPERMGA